MAGAQDRQKARQKKVKLAQFDWHGVDRQGKKIRGFMQAPNANVVKAQLRRQGVTPTKVSKKSKELFAASKKPIKPADIAAFSRQLATMLASGVPIAQSFAVIMESVENPTMAELVNEIKGDIEAGGTISEALKKHPKYFDDLYVDLVAVGEQSGALETIMKRIATYKEKTEATKAKIKKALMYPSVVLGIALTLTAMLLVFVVPTFADMFNQGGNELPALTQIVVNMSDFLQNNFLLVVGALAAAFFGLKHLLRTSQSARDNRDKLLLKLPAFGSIIEESILARTSRTLATTFSAGVPLVEALDSTAYASGNVIFREALLKVKDEVSTGTQMNVAMRDTGVFPAMMLSMISIGEESGAVDEMLDKIASIYEEKVDNAVDGLSSLMEPLIMVVIGGIISVLVIAMYLPIFNMGKNF